MRGLFSWCAIALILTGAAAARGGPSDRVMAPAERAYSTFSEDPHRRFDFWIGDWDVNLRILQEDLTFLDSVAARASIYSILDGKAILELWDSTPIKGYSLRYYDPARERWILSLLWPGPNRSSKSSLEGSFRHGRGDFTTSFTDASGTERHGRYSFNDITPFSLRWDDLWSTDGGKTWSKSWRMEWSRRAVDPEWPIHPERVPTFVDGGRCDAEPFRPYERLAGSWTGDGSRLDAYRVLDGCAVMAFFEAGETREFLIFTWIAAGGPGGAARWEVDILDRERGSPIVTYSSTESWTEMQSDADGTASFTIEGDRLVYHRGERSTALISRPGRSR